MIDEKYELIIIWAWPAWYAAGMYASRYRIKNLIIWAQPGGTLATTHRVENYPWIKSATWREIMNLFKEQAESSWSEILYDIVTELIKEGDTFSLKTSSWKAFKTKHIIVATWSSYKELWVKWEKDFFWRWVSYCATCDWMFFSGQKVVVVWWWNAALTQALYLADIADKVYLIHRSDTFRCETCWFEEANKNPKIEILTNEEVEEIVWDKLWMTHIKLKSWKILDSTGIFVAVWNANNTQILDKLNIKHDLEWSIIVDDRQETNIKWLYAAWDITNKSNKFRQAITAAAEWCIAANSVQEDILKSKN